MSAKLSVIVIFAAGLPSLLITGCDQQACHEVHATITPVEQTASDGKAVSEVQIQLLDLAYETATAIPSRPHLKDRSRTQESIVDACLLLDMPDRALKYIEGIEDWRRGSGYASVAFHLAQRGRPGDVPKYLALAATIAETAGQDWRRDRIRVRIAMTHALLKQDELAKQFEAGVENSEKGKVDAVKAAHRDDATFDADVKMLDDIVSSGIFDLMRNAQNTYIQLYGRHYENTERRDLLEGKLRKSWLKMPSVIQLNILIELADAALKHKDYTTATRLVNDAQEVSTSAQWPVGESDHLSTLARLAGLRYRAGDKERARGDLSAVLARFDAEQNAIIDMYRAAALRSVAEAYAAMNEQAGALATYKRALEAGFVNPNSRPRAEDLAATCRSMALQAVEPDASWWTRATEIRARLGAPW